MATKNLARTIIEGGRARSNQWERNHSHRSERAAARAFLTRASVIEDGFDHLSAPARKRVRKDFADKLGAPRRWLKSQVGRPWDKVRSEIFARFDPRTLAGKHIIFDHLLQEVHVHPENRRWFGWRPDLYVDRNGILRERRSQHPHSGYFVHRATRLPGSVQAWADGRRVAGEDAALFWLLESSVCANCHTGRRTSCCCPVVEGAKAHGAHVHYRQGPRLSASEADHWHSLSDAVQALLRRPRCPNPA